jgi:multidrug efflux pump subunit AcrB
MNLFYRDRRLMILVISLIMVCGLSSLYLLPRMEDPILVPRGAFINTVFPGADPTRVESLVTEKIEDALREIKEIKELRSISREGISTISIELLDQVMEADLIWSKIRDRVETASAEFPSGVLKPRFEEMDFKAYAGLVGLKWTLDSPANFAVLGRFTKDLEDAIKEVPGTEKTDIFGEPEEEISVVIDAEKLAALNLTISDISRQIASSDSKVSAGQLHGRAEDMLLEVSGEFVSIERIEQIPIRQGDSGSFVRLSDLATVERTIVTPAKSMAILDGQRSVVIGTFVRPNYRIDIWSANVQQKLDEFESRLPQGIELKRILDQNEYVETRLSTLFFNLMLGTTAVFFVVFLMMGWRNAIIVTMALPLAAMMVLFGMRIMNIPVHQMSVTGLIIALGLLIDNAIVMVDEVSSRLHRGVSRPEAVSQSVRQLALPLFGSTLTTAFTFAPIALMPGPAGEFVGAIALNVILAIFSSLFLAMTIIPAFAAIFYGNESNSSEAFNNKIRGWLKTGIKLPRVSEIYSRLIKITIGKPVIGIAIGLLFPICGFIGAQQLKEQFFPPADRNQLHVELELSSQSSIEGTLALTRLIRESLLSNPDVFSVDWFVGESAPAFYYNLIPRRSSVSQYAQAVVQLDSVDNLAATIQNLQAEMDHQFPSARLLVRQLEQGPPFDAPIEIRLFGPDLERLQQLGAELREFLVWTEGVIHTRSEMEQALPKIKFEINEEKARVAGFQLSDIANQLSALTDGAVGGSILESTEELPVRVRLSNSRRGSIDNLESVSIVNQRTTFGDFYTAIPLTSLAEVQLEPEYGSIQHFSSVRMNEIQVYIPAGVLPSSVLTAFQNQLADANFQLPPGYELRYGGEAAKRDEAVSNLMASVGILLVLMIATLVLSFGSFRVATIVGLVGILSMGLGMGALFMFGFPFGFMAIVGTMGLLGVAINDTIVVLAAIQANENASAGNKDAMHDVVMHSSRHIISTSLTTMAGFAPLIIAGGKFWPPLAVAIAGGVGGATILALFFAPSCYILLGCSPSSKGSSSISDS